jgi:hypothetical protein
MNICETLPRAEDLSYCTAKNYGPGLLHIGEVDAALTDPAVTLTNRATGRAQILAVDVSALPQVVVTMPGDLSPGTLYELRVVAPTSFLGIKPAPFLPFQYDYVASTFIPATDPVQGVTVKFIKVFDGASVHQYEEQWISLR